MTAIIPVKNLTTEDILYGDRSTSHRWEVLEHRGGQDYLVGVLDGVQSGALSWNQNAAVKGAGSVRVADLSVSRQGTLRIRDLKLESARLRPVSSVQAPDGSGSALPDMAWGTFLITVAREEWDETGRVWQLELLDRSTVIAEDAIDESFSVPVGTLILPTVQSLVSSAGESLTIDPDVLLATSSGMVWPAGTSKLTIVNELLASAGYNSLWVDGWGELQATPRVLPAERSAQYEMFNLPRELRDGDKSIYSPDWSREKDSYRVPNKVVAVQAATGLDTQAQVGVWTNEDPASPYSYPSRGRWITHTIDFVECPEGTPEEIIAFLENRARATLIQMSSVQAQIRLTHLPIPVKVGDALQFENRLASTDSRHIITRVDLDLSTLGLMKTTIQEVISL